MHSHGSRGTVLSLYTNINSCEDMNIHEATQTLPRPCSQPITGDIAESHYKMSVTDFANWTC